MKVAKPIRDAFDACKLQYERLKEDTRDRLKREVEEKKWFYADRVKELESFALKIETGKVAQPNALEDFFACTVIVPTLSQIEKAVEVISNSYEIVYRRPINDSDTTKQASNFMFDDLRLYVRRKPAADGRVSDLDQLLFEVQVKTILQHAWGIATHDLTYKTDSVSWPMERIAFQVKAMLEHAELAIAQAEALATAAAVAKQDQHTKDLLKVIEQIRAVWVGGRSDELPTDLKRLAETVCQLLAVARIPPAGLKAIIEQEIKRYGILPNNLSPYAFILQSLLQNAAIDFENKFTSEGTRLTLVIHEDMELPDWVKVGNPRVFNL